MTLEKFCYRDFDAVTRARGEDDFRSGLVRLELIAPRAARFQVHVEPESKKTVHLEWSDAGLKGVLRSSCSCESFQKNSSFCQHIWASLLGSDVSEQRELKAARLIAAEFVEANKKLTLEPLSSEISMEVLKDSIDLEASKSWPLTPLAAEGLARFTRIPEGGLALSLHFRYRALEIPPDWPDEVLLDRSSETRIRRIAKAEKALLRPFKGPFALKKLDRAIEEREAHPLMAALLEVGWKVDLEGKAIALFTRAQGVLGEYKDGFGFAAAFEFSGEMVSLKAFAEASWQREGFVAVGTSRMGCMPEDWVKRIELISRCASLSKEGYMLISRSAMPLLKPVFEEAPGVKVDAASQKIFKGLATLSEKSEIEKPQGLKASLRPYQAEGVAWLDKIAAGGFGGILADDMGLGKTVQVISYLLRRANLQNAAPGSKKPALVVLPKSLVFNWLNEVEKFAPRLRVLDFASAKRGLLRAADYDVIVTTYHVMKNELDRLEKVEFDTIILDEAQAIKNSTSQVTQAVYKLRGRHRFALSGTPIENSLDDLFSLMRFANPGLIPSTLARSIGDGRGGETPKTVLERLSVAVSPFILRRTKKQVLKELPDKCEQTLLCSLEGPQKKMYDDLRRRYKASLAGNLREKGMSKAETQVFEALLRMRQASCHPGLVDEELAKGTSAKFEVLLEHLEEIRAAGHKALVFSQFTSFLKLLKPHLKEAGLKFEYLDGQTSNRGAVVDRFNNSEETTVFLISLKAGGTGLNLTSASYVFLLDPWWNPAIESQAIDRAYRMGQKQKVMAYRLIAEGTIEEKIMRLQAQKRNLADAVISEDSTFLRSLSMDDLASLFD